MTPLAFVSRHIGRSVQSPGGMGGQCVDLVNLYLVEALNQPVVYADAANWAGLDLPGLVWTPNTPTNVAPTGSLLVWGQYPPLAIGRYGHIALCLVADVMHLVSFDQDWPVGANSQLILHEYGGVLGWHQPVR